MGDDLDTLLRALANERRRRTLAALQRHRSLTLADLADELAVTERGVPLVDVSAEFVQRIYMDLYHRQVPMLADADLVVYEQEPDLVGITDQGENVVSTVSRELGDALS